MAGPVTVGAACPSGGHVNQMIVRDFCYFSPQREQGTLLSLPAELLLIHA